MENRAAFMIFDFGSVDVLPVEIGVFVFGFFLDAFEGSVFSFGCEFSDADWFGFCFIRIFGLFYLSVIIFVWFSFRMRKNRKIILVCSHIDRCHCGL